MGTEQDILEHRKTSMSRLTLRGRNKKYSALKYILAEKLISLIIG